MKRLILAAALALMITPTLVSAGGSGYYDWQFSFSNTDPNMNSSAPISGGFVTVYLWYTGCNSADAQPGMSAAEMDVSTTGDFSLPAPMTVMNGFLNAGTSNEKLLLVVGGCPAGPLLAGSFFVQAGGAGEGTLGLVPSADNGFAVVVDCTGQDGWFWPAFVRYQGCGTTGAGPIQNHGNGCTVTSVESDTWGAIKGLYR